MPTHSCQIIFFRNSEENSSATSPDASKVEPMEVSQEEATSKGDAAAEEQKMDTK